MRRCEATEGIPALDVVDLCSLFKRFMLEEAAGASAVYALTPSPNKGVLTLPTEWKSSGNEICQIKVTLLRTARPIWRRLLIPARSSD